MKFFRLWKEKKIIKLGETPNEEDAKWYTYEESLEKFLEYLKRDDEVNATINNVNGKDAVVFLKKLEAGEVAEAPKEMATEYTPSNTASQITKLSTSEQILRLSIMRAVGNAVVALTGQISQADVVDFMCDSYDKLKAKVEA